MNPKSVLIQPLGDEGLLILGADTIRGINNNDKVQKRENDLRRRRRRK